MNPITQLLTELKIRNFDDRSEKLGNRRRDKVCASLEGMTLTKDRYVLKGVLSTMPKKEVWF